MTSTNSLCLTIYGLLESEFANNYFELYRTYNTRKWRSYQAIPLWKNQVQSFTEKSEKSKDELERAKFKLIASVWEKLAFKLFEHTSTPPGRLEVIKQLFGGEQDFERIETVTGEFEGQTSYVVKKLGPNGANDWIISLKIDHFAEELLGILPVKPIHATRHPHYMESMKKVFDHVNLVMFQVHDCEHEEEREKHRGWWIQWEGYGGERFLTSRFVHTEFNALAWVLKLAKNKSEQRKAEMINELTRDAELINYQGLATLIKLHDVVELVISYMGIGPFHDFPVREEMIAKQEVLSVEQIIPPKVESPPLGDPVSDAYTPLTTSLYNAIAGGSAAVGSVFSYLGSYIISPTPAPASETPVMNSDGLTEGNPEVLRYGIQPDISAEEMPSVLKDWLDSHADNIN